MHVFALTVPSVENGELNTGQPGTEPQGNRREFLSFPLTLILNVSVSRENRLRITFVNILWTKVQDSPYCVRLVWRETDIAEMISSLG